MTDPQVGDCYQENPQPMHEDGWCNAHNDRWQAHQSGCNATMTLQELGWSPQELLDSCDCESVGVYHSHKVPESQDGSQRLPRWLERSLVRDETGSLKRDGGWDA